MFVLRIVLLFLITTIYPVFAGQKVVLFNDTSAWYHWGCTGTSIALKEEFQSLGFSVQAIPINTTYALKEIPDFAQFDSLESLNLFCSGNREIIQAIQDADAVVITGEGTIHDLGGGPRALLYLAYMSKIYFGKHVEIINHSAYPKDNPQLSASFLSNFGVEKEVVDTKLKEAEAIYKSVYVVLDFVAIREPFSHAVMKQIDVCSQLSFDCLPLYIHKHYQQPKHITEKAIVLAGSVAHNEEGIQNICRYLEAVENRGIKIKVLIGAAAFPSKDDKKFVALLRKYCQAAWELVDATSMDEWLNTINNASLLVSGRFHHSIAAFCLNTPFIALNSNTPKVHAICALLEQPEPFLYSDPALLESLLQRTTMIFNSPPLDNSVKAAYLRELAQKNFEGLRKLIEIPLTATLETYSPRTL